MRKQKATYIKISINGNGLNLVIDYLVTVKDKTVRKIELWIVQVFLQHLRSELVVLFPFVMGYGINHNYTGHIISSLKAENTVNGNFVLCAQRRCQIILEELL